MKSKKLKKSSNLLSKSELGKINGGRVAIVECANGYEYCFASGLTQSQIVGICANHGGFVRQKWG
ncbi:MULTISPECIES: hypothetical protein [unclassified Flavobacterium]|uniref:hypothetical protein n=1 Tax=unclassified Flavobacterium TaxID=196869 RepID=UPI00262567AA|nr:hypothetical protein [Flavobacterium sp.]